MKDHPLAGSYIRGLERSEKWGHRHAPHESEEDDDEASSRKQESHDHWSADADPLSTYRCSGAAMTRQPTLGEQRIPTRWSSTVPHSVHVAVAIKVHDVSHHIPCYR
jgi:hypothetical protein